MLTEPKIFDPIYDMFGELDRKVKSRKYQQSWKGEQDVKEKRIEDSKHDCKAYDSTYDPNG